MTDQVFSMGRNWNKESGHEGGEACSNLGSYS